MKTFQTKIFNQINPIGFDFEVYLLQLQFLKLPWLDAIYGVAHRQKREKSFYPQGFENKYQIQDNINLVDLTFDDKYASRIFFSMNDANLNPSENKWDWVDLDVQIKQKFSLILHCNLTSLEIVSSEQIKLDVLWMLNSCPKLIGFQLTENIDEIWKSYTLTPEMVGCTLYPNYCLRVDMVCNYPAFPTNGQNGYQPNY